MKKFGYKQFKATHDGGSSRLDAATLTAEFRGDGCVHHTLTLVYTNYAGYGITCVYDLDSAEDRSDLGLQTASSENEKVDALFRERRHYLGNIEPIPGIDYKRSAVVDELEESEGIEQW